MSKQTLNIELDVPADYEVTGEFRRPKCDELYLSFEYDRAKIGRGTGIEIRSYPILRKAWAPPSYIPDGYWLYQYADRQWFVQKEEPVPAAGGGYRSGSELGSRVEYAANQIASGWNTKFVPPPSHLGKKIQVRHAA